MQETKLSRHLRQEEISDTKVGDYMIVGKVGGVQGHHTEPITGIRVLPPP